jgi:hypothetical protein
MRSVVVVFPASICAMMPMFLVRWSADAGPLSGFVIVLVLTVDLNPCFRNVRQSS